MTDHKTQFTLEQAIESKNKQRVIEAGIPLQNEKISESVESSVTGLKSTGHQIIEKDVKVSKVTKQASLIKFVTEQKKVEPPEKEKHIAWPEIPKAEELEHHIKDQNAIDIKATEHSDVESDRSGSWVNNQVEVFSDIIEQKSVEPQVMEQLKTEPQISKKEKTGLEIT
ncbi:Uncharacterised protein [uncultured archaeon]|nr:Uncharacterised protein [uncultured archaeon]